MAKGDTFDAFEGDEIELTFQLNLKRADLQKRRDASQLTHVSIELAAEAAADPSRAGQVKFEALDADVTGDPTVNQILPITQDDPKFTRLYRVGRIENFANIPTAEMIVRVRTKLVPKEGELKASNVPADADLCRIRVKARK